MRLAQPAMAVVRHLDGVIAKRDRGRRFGDRGVRARIGARDVPLVVIVVGTAIDDDHKPLLGVDAERIDAAVLASLWMTPSQPPARVAANPKNTPSPRQKTQYVRNTTARPSKNSISDTQASIVADHRRITAVLC